MQKPKSKYEQQAEDFLRKHHLTISIVRDWDQSCPPWAECKPLVNKHTHGIRYGVVVGYDAALPKHYEAPSENAHLAHKKLYFPFWDSLAHLEKPFRRPQPYDVLACISGEVYVPENFEEWCSETGCEEDSRRDYATWERCRALNQELKAFFTPEALEDLKEIH